MIQESVAIHKLIKKALIIDSSLEMYNKYAATFL